MNNYNQLCGAIGILWVNGVELNRREMLSMLRDLGRRVGIAKSGDPLTGAAGTGFLDPVHDEVSMLLRHYRKMCLERGLIHRGELFDYRDAEAMLRWMA